MLPESLPRQENKSSYLKNTIWNQLFKQNKWLIYSYFGFKDYCVPFSSI